MCPYYLDGDNCHIPRRSRSRMITSSVSLEHVAGLSKWRRAEIAMQFSKIAEEAVARVSHDGLSKLNSMLGRRRRPKAPDCLGGSPSPVDVPGRSGVSCSVHPTCDEGAWVPAGAFPIRLL